MRYFIAGGGCYGSYYVRQLDRARERKKLDVTEIVVVDKDSQCAVAKTLPQVEGARLEVCDWIDFGEVLWKNRALWRNDMWVPTPLGPHIIYHWIKKQWEKESGQAFQPVAYTGPMPQLPYAQTLATGSLVLSHAPGICPVNCVEPKICPLTKDDRDWEMKDTVRKLVAEKADAHGIEAVGVFVCQHHAHGVGTIPLKDLFAEWEAIHTRLKQGNVSRIGVATVSSCHGILDTLELPQKRKIG